MRGMTCLIAAVVSLVLLPAAAAGNTEATDRYGCGGPIVGKGGNIVGAKKIDGPLTLSRRDYEAWGPIGVSGMIGCDGRVHDLEFDKQLPEELATRLRDDLGEWRFEPAHLKGKPMATIYQLTLNLSEIVGGAPVGEESANRYGCGEPVKGSGEQVVRPKRIRYARTALSPRELEKWGPIGVSGMIGCDGKVHDLEIDKELPKKLEAKLRRNIGKSRYKPATLAGEPVAVYYKLILNRPF